MPILKVYDESTQSWVSIPSVQGETGAAAGFGTPTISVDSTTGTPSATVTASGEDTSKVFSFAFSGLKGAKGDDGTTPSTTVTTITGGHNVAFSYGSGDPRNTDFNVMDGQDGSGIPTGGTTGQTLVKSSNTDYAVTWGDVHQVPSGGTQGQVLTKASATDFDTAWANASGGDKVMCVTLTYTNGSYSSDKSIDEIITANSNGYDIFLKYGNLIYPLYSCNSSIKTAIFTYTNVNSSQYIYGYTYTFTYNTSYTNNTRVQYSSISFSRPSVDYQDRIILNYDSSTGEYSIAYQSGNLSDLDTYGTGGFGSFYLCLAKEGNELPETYVYANTADYYYPTKYWRTEAYDEYYEYYCSYSNAIFSKIDNDSGTIKLKSFTIVHNDSEGGEVITYSEVSLGQAPSAQGVSF